jgi:hypothetical protein
VTASAVFIPLPTIPACSTAVPTPIVVPLIGGGQYVFPQPPNLLGDALAPALQAMRDLGMQLAPMVPSIILIRAVVAIRDFIIGLPGNIAQAVPPILNARPLADSITNVENALVAVVSLASPQFAFARMLLGFVRVMRLYLQAMRDRVVTLIRRNTDINDAIAKATALGNTTMLQNAQCAQQRLASDIDALNASAASAGAVIQMFGVLLCLLIPGHVVAIPAVPTVDANALAAEVFDPPLAVLDALESRLGPLASVGADFRC